MNAVEAAFAPVIGLPCWGVKRGFGSFLTMEFGEPHLEVHELRQGEPAAPGYSVRRRKTRRLAYARGEWHLWIYCCHWYVFSDGKRIGDSENHLERAVKELNGQKLTSVTFSALPGRSAFHFDLGARLSTRPYDDRPMEQWFLYEPTGMVLSFRSDNRYSHQQQDTPSDQETWHTLGGDPIDEGRIEPALVVKAPASMER